MTPSQVALVTLVTSDFHFRTKDGYKRPSVSVEHSAPTVEGIIEALTGEDAVLRAMIVDTVQGIVVDQVRNHVLNDKDFGAEQVAALEEQGKLSLAYVAHIPKADRNVLSKDDLEVFAVDYIAVMPELTGKDVARVQAAASLFVERFKRAAGDNDVLTVLQSQLAAFVDGVSPEVLERNERVCTWAAAKLEELLSIKVTADSL